MSEPADGPRPSRPRRPPRQRQQRRQRRAPSARTALTAAFAIFLLACLAAIWLSLTSLPGFGFAAGTVIAAGSVRRRDLLIVVAAPPALFLLAVACAGLLSAWQNGTAISPLPVAAACLLTLSTAAPWLFGGMAGALVLAEVRGLNQCVRDLRTALAAVPATATAAAPGVNAASATPLGPARSAGQSAVSGRWPRARAATRGARRR